MKRKIIVALCIVFAIGASTPFLLNLRRVSAYEERVAKILSFKTENWYLPKEIPEGATNVYYKYSEGWGQGGSSNTLKFRLPEHAAQELRSQISSKANSQRRTSSSRPEIASSDEYHELVWTTFDGNHGSEGGVWYDAAKHEFVFHHYVW